MFPQELLGSLTQIATTLGGVEAGDLISKEHKERLHKSGYVWPMYGSVFWLTPSGKALCESFGIAVAPFSCLGEASLLARASKCVDSEWDRKKINDWLPLAIPGWSGDIASAEVSE